MTFWRGSSAINELRKLICYVSTESIQEQVSLALLNPIARDIFLNSDQIMPLAGLKPASGTSSLPGPKPRLINLVHKLFLKWYMPLSYTSSHYISKSSLKPFLLTYTFYIKESMVKKSSKSKSCFFRVVPNFPQVTELTLKCTFLTLKLGPS